MCNASAALPSERAVMALQGAVIGSYQGFAQACVVSCVCVSRVCVCVSCVCLVCQCVCVCLCVWQRVGAGCVVRRKTQSKGRGSDLDALGPASHTVPKNHPQKPRPPHQVNNQPPMLGELALACDVLARARAAGASALAALAAVEAYWARSSSADWCWDWAWDGDTDLFAGGDEDPDGVASSYMYQWWVQGPGFRHNRRRLRLRGCACRWQVAAAAAARTSLSWWCVRACAEGARAARCRPPPRPPFPPPLPPAPARAPPRLFNSQRHRRSMPTTTQTRATAPRAQLQRGHSGEQRAAGARRLGTHAQPRRYPGAGGRGDAAVQVRVCVCVI
jgi:hypothetical protein